MKRKDIGAVILAGGKNEGWTSFPNWTPRSDMSSAFTALVDVNGKPMYSYVLDALMGTGIEDITIVGEWTNKVIVPECQTISGGKSLIENVADGLRSLGNRIILLATCDLPALTSEAIQDFVEKCQGYESLDLGCPVVLINDCYKKFPGILRTGKKIAEGNLTTGNLFWMNRRKMLQLENLDRIERIFKSRKSVRKLAMLLGPQIMFRFLLAKKWPQCLRLRAIEKRAGRILKLRVAAIMADSEIGTDIDTPEQLETYLAITKSQAMRL